MSAGRITLLLLCGAAIQTLLPVELPLLLCLLIVITIQSDRIHHLYAAGLAVFLFDALSPAPLGTSVLFFVPAAEGIRLIRNEVFGDQLITYLILGAILTLFKSFYFALVFSLSGLRPVGAGGFLVYTAAGALGGALLCPLVFATVSRLPRPAHLRRRRMI